MLALSPLLERLSLKPGITLKDCRKRQPILAYPKLSLVGHILQH
jgi:hypothetical protein